MPSSNQSRRRGGSSQRPNRNRQRPAGQRQGSQPRPASQPVGGRSLNGVGSHDTGYTLHRGGTRSRGRGSSIRRNRSRNPRSIALMVVIACLLLLIIFGVSSCVSSCTAAREQKQTEEQQADTNPVDSRVAYGASENISQELSSALDNGEKLQKIAANATAYSDDRIIELALREPSAIDFVEQLPTASKDPQPYTGTVVQGTYPVLYDWDTRWAFMDYGSLPLGLTGSGPTSIAMAYMGLTGKSDKTPAVIAQLALDGNYATGASGTSSDFIKNAASSLGLSCTGLDATEANITGTLDDSTCILVELQAGTVTDESHWALLVSLNRDTSVTLYDPTSTSASAHTWDAGTIADSATTLYALTVDASASTDSSSSSTESSSTSDTTSTGSTGTGSTSSSTTGSSTASGSGSAASNSNK